MTMNNDNNVPVVNTSGTVRTIGATTRHVERGQYGRWVPRGSTLVRPLPQPSGLGGYDAVIGCRPEGWIPGARNNAVLHRDPMDFEAVHYVSPDYSGHMAISASLDAGQYPRRRA
jgi:hypothetical protein